jgi:hypothetical protein
MPFFDRFAVMSKPWIKGGRHAGEVAKSFDIRTALEVALIERKEPGTPPVGIDKSLLGEAEDQKSRVRPGETPQTDFPFLGFQRNS